MFAVHRHHGQHFSGTGLPYLTHIGAVVMTLLPALLAGEADDAELSIVCAILHDTVEDTETTLKEIQEEFGEAVAAGVSALTKSEEKSGEDAMRDSLDRILRQPRDIWRVKLSDRIANLGLPPAHWSKEKCLAYAAEGELILETLGGASDRLAAQLKMCIADWRER